MLKRVKGFTLVEMLIVMGILAILMAIGVSVARFAIQRSNNIQHQSAADQMFQAFQSYYTDNRNYPTAAEFVDFGTALGAGGVLDDYVDASFDGGSPATFYYFVEPDNQQSFLVCVSFGGQDDTSELGGYCNGNGFGELVTDPLITDKVMDSTDFAANVNANADSTTSDWDGAAWE